MPQNSDNQWYNNAIERIDEIEEKGYLYANHPESFGEVICWCGSFQKYKDCHLKYSKFLPLTYDDYWKICKKYYNRRGKCFYENCSESSINSHSVPSSWLMSIANEIKSVYQFQYDIFESLVKNEPNPFKPKAISVTKSSTFRGFCSRHDSELFKDLEFKREWEVSSRNILLLFYRCVCYELFRKYTVRDLSIELRSKAGYGKDLFSQVESFQHFTQHLLGVEKAIEDLEALRSTCENCIKNKDYTSLSYTYIPFKKSYQIMAGGIHHPIKTFSSNTLQEMSEDSLLNIACVLGKNGDYGFALFVNLESEDPRSKLFHQDLLRTKNLAKRIVVYLLESTENLFWEIDNWNNLSKSNKQKTFDLLGDTILEDTLEYCREGMNISLKTPIVDNAGIIQSGV